MGGGRSNAGVAGTGFLFPGRLACNKCLPQRTAGRALPISAADTRALSNAQAAGKDDIVPFKLADIGEGITGNLTSELVLCLANAARFGLIREW